MSRFSDWIEENPNKFYLLGLGMFFVICFFIGFTGFYDAFTESQVDSLIDVVMWLIMLPVSIVTLKVKDRSLWWMLLWGLCSPLWLKNAKVSSAEIKLEQLEAENIKLKQEVQAIKDIEKLKDNEEIII